MSFLNKLFPALLVVTLLMFVYAPVLILQAPYESTMGLVQKIFYFHVPAWFAAFSAVLVSGVSGGVFLATGRSTADRLSMAAAELAVCFGLIGLITGPLWAYKAWGVWWQWDAKLTGALVLELIFVAFLLLRRYAGPGSERLSAVLAVLGLANVPFVYWSVNLWRTVHPKTSVVPSLQPGMRGTFWFCVTAFLLLFIVLLAARARLEASRAELDALFLATED